MARYLSDEWFEQLGAGDVPPDPAPVGPVLVLAHIVSEGPDGETRYHVQITGGRAQVVRGDIIGPPADATFSENYATAAAVASGELSTAAALLAGRIRVAGDMATLVHRQGELAIEDPVPPAVRAATTY